MILTIAPFSPDLTTIPDEVASLANLIPGTKIVQGNVTEEKILAIVQELKRTGERVDGIWLCGHGTDNGFMLTSGMLDVRAIVQYVSALSPEWLFINACESQSLVDQIQQWVDVDVVSILGEVPDADAYRTARLFALTYNELKDVRQALALAAPGGAGWYRHWPSLRHRPRGPSTPMIDTPEEEELWKKLQESVTKLWVAIYGSEEYDTKGLRSEVKNLWQSVLALEEARNSNASDVKMLNERVRILTFAILTLLAGLTGAVTSVVAIILRGA